MSLNASPYNGTLTERSVAEDDSDLALEIELCHEQLDSKRLDRMNQIIAAAIGTWKLPERVKRIGLPLYQYHECDLPHMRFLIAKTGACSDFFGLAALEDADTVESRQYGALWLHGIYVDPRVQRKRIGTRLLEAAEIFSVASNARGLLVRAQSGAVPFFEANGYKRLPIEDPARDYAHRFWKLLENQSDF